MSMTQTQESKAMASLGSILSRFWAWVANPHPAVTEIGDRRRAQLLASLSLLLVLPLSIGLLFRFLVNDPSDWMTIETYEFLGLVLFSLLAYILSRTQYFQWGSISLVTAFSITALTNSISSNTVSSSFYFLVPAFVIGSALLRLSGISTLVIINVLIIFLLPMLSPTIEQSFAESGIVLTTGLLLILVVAIRNLIERERLAEVESVNQELRSLQSSLQQRVANATRDLELASEVAQNVALLQDPAAMLSKAVELIRERFDLYYTQIYLTDTAGRNLILSAGTGEVGQTLIRRGHRLAIDLGSINGIAALERRTVIVVNTEESSLHRSNPLLPKTRSEMAVPMIAGERVMGVIDLQSSQAGALSAENLTAFEVLARQLAITIVNINLFTEVERSSQQVEAQTRRLTHEGWREFLDGIQRKEFLGFCYENDDFTPLIEPITPQGDPESLIMPIQVLGESVGTLKFEGERPWTEDDHQTVNAVSHQVAQQVENLRLLAQAEQYQNEAQEALRRLTREGWGGYQEKLTKRNGFVYQDHEVKLLGENGNGFEDAIKYEIKVRDEPIGELAIDGVETVNEENIELVAYVNEQLSAHLENLRLATQTEIALSETEEQAQQLETLNEIGRGLNAAANEDEILAAIIEPAQQAGCESATLFYIQDYENSSPEWMTQVANWRPDGESFVPAGYQYDLREFPTTNLLFANPDSVQLIENINNDDRVDVVLKGLWIQNGFKAITIIPIIQAGKWLGLVTFGWSETHRFSPQEKEIYDAIMSLITPTVHSRRLFEQAQAALAETESMLEITSIASSSLELETTFTQVLNKVLEITNAGSGLISVYNPQTEALELVSHDLPEPLLMKLRADGLQGTLCDLVYQKNETLILEDLKSDAPLDTTGLIKLGFQAYQGVPLVSKGSVTGTLCIFYNRVINAQDADTTILEVVGQQIGVAIENAHLFDQTQSALNDAETFRQLAEASGQGVGMTTMDGISTYVNPRMIEMLGLKEAGDILGKPFTPLYPEEHQQKINGEIMSHLQDTGNWTGELALTRVDGSIFPTLENFFLLMDDDGNPQYLVDIVNDITERQAHEATTAKRAAELATVAEVGTIISTVLEEQTLLETVVRLTRERFDLYHCHIFLADDDFQTLQVKACGWQADSPHAGTIEQVLIHTDQEQSLVAQAARDQQSIIVNDVQAEAGWLPNHLLPETRSEMAIPMVAGNQILGVLDVQADQVGRFTDEDISIMNTLSSQVAVALQNARTYAQTETRTEELAILNEMGRILTTQQDESAIYETIFEYAGKLINVETFFIAIYDREKHEIDMPILYEDGKMQSMSSLPAGAGLTNYIIQTRKSLLISDNFDKRLEEIGIEQVTFGDASPVVSWVGVPLIFQDRINGIISIQSKIKAGLYTEHDLDLLSTIASQATLALENASAFRQTQQQADQEATINLISQRIQSTTSVESALQVAVRELGRALGAKRTNVQLGLPGHQDKS